jgi:hypothetical protein
MNSEPLSLSMPVSGKGMVAFMSRRASKTYLWALLRVGRSSTQPEYTSVAVKVRHRTKVRTRLNPMSRSGGQCRFQKSLVFCRRRRNKCVQGSAF